MHVLKKSRAIEVFCSLKVTISRNYKYLFEELEAGNGQISVHLVFYKHDFPKAAALCNISWTIIYKMCGHSFDSHCLEKLVGILLMAFSILLSTWWAYFSTGKLSMTT